MHRICTFSWNISENTDTVNQAINKNAAYLEPHSSATIVLVNMSCFTYVCSKIQYEVAVLSHVKRKSVCFVLLLNILKTPNSTQIFSFGI
jgi:hypothetical protein